VSTKLYPLKFKPILKERLWGGSRLRDVFGKSIPNEITGESWELSAVDEDVSILVNGEFKGKSLKELIRDWEVELLGDVVFSKFGHEFPVLIKFIDAKMDLSVQVHPDDELAGKRHRSLGKTEMWYIMDAEEDAHLILGFNKDVSREQYQKFLEEGRIMELLNFQKVKEGDTFFINAGTIHAIGAGVLLAEIQQASDVTYRIFDFDRKNIEGKTRELHTELALDAMEYRRKVDFNVNYSKKNNQLNPMVRCPYFKTDYLELTADMVRRSESKESFTILICVQGYASVYNEAGSAEIQYGETVLIPAGSTVLGIRTMGAKFLEVTL